MKRKDCCWPAVAGTGKTPAVCEDLSADPQNAPAPRDNSRPKCVGCGRAGRVVTRKTLLLMLKSEMFDQLWSGEYRFCPEAECHIVYFHASGKQTFTTADVRVRVGLKERTDPIPLCYCFGFDEADVRREIESTGRATIPRRIAEFLKQKVCACPARNPSGACCLGEVTKAVRRLTAQRVQ